MDETETQTQDGQVNKKADDIISAGGTALPSDGTAEGFKVLAPEEVARITDDIVAAIKTVYDPEIPVDIYELGLIYKVDLSDERHIHVDMTLTAPGCPVAGEMPEWVLNAVLTVPGVQTAKVELTFDPPWDMSRMSDEARMALNMF